MNVFSDQAAETVAAWGEVKLIRAITKWLGAAAPPPPFGAGDDCAVLPGSTTAQLITVDPVIYGEHFNDSMPAAGAGAKLLKRNVSDIASMGGTPTHAVLALALSPQTRTAWLRGFIGGLRDAALEYGVTVVGGDVAPVASGLVATLTQLGTVGHDRALTRTGAQPGDWIYVTGTLGGSILGHHMHFSPRVAAGQWLARQPAVRAMTDLSDGIAKDVWGLCPEGCRPQMAIADLPISASAKKIARRTGQAAWRHALQDGEDYELLLAVAADVDQDAFQRSWAPQFGFPLTCVGRFGPKRSRPRPGEVDWHTLHGFSHFSSLPRK